MLFAAEQKALDFEDRMDMVFRDDECLIRTDNAPENFVTLKQMANNLIRRAPGIPNVSTHYRVLGRRLPRKSRCNMNSFTRFP